MNESPVPNEDFVAAITHAGFSGVDIALATYRSAFAKYRKRPKSTPVGRTAYEKAFFGKIGSGPKGLTEFTTEPDASELLPQRHIICRDSEGDPVAGARLRIREDTDLILSSILSKKDHPDAQIAATRIVRRILHLGPIYLGQAVTQDGVRISQFIAGYHIHKLPREIRDECRRRLISAK